MEGGDDFGSNRWTAAPFVAIENVLDGRLQFGFSGLVFFLFLLSLFLSS